MQPTTSPYIEVRKSKIHGTGVYAKKDIPREATIIEYTGRKITKEESDKIYEQQYAKHEQNKEHDGAVYIFELNKEWDIDGKVLWNTARYINHSCSPNAETANTGEEILIQAIRSIKKGEEITYNYGYSLENYKDHPCRCGAKNCVGYIVDEDLWPKLKRKEKRRKRKSFWRRLLYN